MQSEETYHLNGMIDYGVVFYDENTQKYYRNSFATAKMYDMDCNCVYEICGKVDTKTGKIEWYDT